MLRSRVLVLVSSLITFASPAASATTASPASKAIEACIEAYTAPLVARGDLSGQLLVLRKDHVAFERSFGRANAELGVAATAGTRYNIASVTKPMTAILAIQLMEEHKLSPGDSLARWFRDFPKADSIRVTDLLRHRSGIPHETIPDSEMTRPFTAAEVVERAKKLPLDFPPGARESYSSGGYEVLARILELAGGTSYAELLASRIFRPLGMTHSAHADGRALMPGRSTGYVPGPHGLENAPLQDFSALVGAGSVWSNARDLHLFVHAIVTGKLGPGTRLSYVRKGRLDFNGRTGGFKAWAMWDSAGAVEAIFVGNVASGAPDALKRDILRLAAGELVAPPSLPALRTEPMAEEELRRWEGVYQIEHGPRLELRVRNGALYSNDWVMLPAADGSFFSPRDYGIVRGVKAADGKLERLEWTQGTDTYPAPRVGD
jgi:CubicO group peptidase (beta-lactamase class C family)